MNVPPLLFLIGPNGCGKTTLAQHLSEDHHFAMCSFNEPIREMTLQCFFPEQLNMGIDLRNDDATKEMLPALGVSIGDFMFKLRALLTDHSAPIMGELAKRRISLLSGQLYNHFVFDDTLNPADVQPFVGAYGRNNCKLIFIERSGMPLAPLMRRFEGTFLPRLVVRNPEGNPEAMAIAVRGPNPTDKSTTPFPVEL